MSLIEEQVPLACVCFQEGLAAVVLLGSLSFAVLTEMQRTWACGRTLRRRALQDTEGTLKDKVLVHCPCSRIRTRTLIDELNHATGTICSLFRGELTGWPLTPMRLMLAWPM